MNKKIVFAAVVAGFALPFAAHADVKVYGAAQSELVSGSDDAPDATADQIFSRAGTGDNKGTAITAGQDSVSEEDDARGRIGVKASEDLGNGLKGIAKFEYRTDTTDNVGKGTLVLAPRDSMVGLKGGFGTVMMGRLKSPYKYTGGVKYDKLVTTAMEARGNGGMSNGAYGHSGFLDKTIGWNSPKMSGVQVKLNYRLDEGGTNGEAAGQYALAVEYANGPINAFVATIDRDDHDGNGQNYSAVKVGGAYTTGPINVRLQYEMITNENIAAATDDGKEGDETILFLGFTYKMGKSSVVVQFGQNTVDGNNFNDVTYIALALWHKLSKSTSAWIGYRSTSDVEGVIAIGMRKGFSS